MSLPNATPCKPDVPSDEKPISLRSLLTRRVVIAAANYAMLSLVDIAFRAIQPLFFSTPIHLGGLGLPPPIIGNIMAVFGILNGVFQVFFFAKIHDRWGSKTVFIAGIVSAIPVFAAFPIMNLLARTQGLSLALWVVVGLQIVISIMLSLSYSEPNFPFTIRFQTCLVIRLPTPGSIFIYISASAPSPASLGATNGLAQMSVSVMRAIGPAAANSLFSLSVEKHYLGGSLVYYLLMGVVGASIIVATMLPRQVWT